MAACWRRHERYVLRDTDGHEITPARGRAISKQRFTISDDIRKARRRATKAKQHKQRTGKAERTSRCVQESTKAAPASGPSTGNATEAA